ncbi:MAG: NADH-quinone oxidoreductase subunit N [Planctomycetaceae bacterium]
MDEAVVRIAGAWQLILPEIVLVAAACIHFLVGPFLVGERGEAPAGLQHRWGGLAVAALLAAGGIWWQMRPADDPASLGPFRLDDLTWFVRGLSLAAGTLLLLTSWNRVEPARSAEHHACLLLIVAGVSLVAAANDLVTLFLALELVSIPTYVLLYLGRSDAVGQEATLKYFLLSVFSSAFTLFGLSYLYGAAGTTNLTAIDATLATGATSPALLIVAAMVIAGLAFRVTAVPFHFYAPDVFQGTTTGGAAMLSFVPKVAGFVALLRILSISESDGHSTLGESAEPALWALAIVSMTVGNVLALLQTDVRRMMAYSSIAHAGYMLVGLAAAPHDGGAVRGVPALLFYLAVYGAMTLGVFAILAAVRIRRSDGTPESSDARIETTDEFAGLSQAHPVAALLMTIFLFSLTGLPPTAGFLGKLNLFLAAWSADSAVARWTAALMALNAGIAAWYYLRLIGVMYLQPATEASPRAIDPPAFVGAALCAAATIALFIAPDWLWHAVARIGG